MKLIPYKTLFLFLACLAMQPQLYGQWLLQASDDFDSYAFGGQPGGNWYSESAASATTANDLVTDADGGTNTFGVTLPANNLGTGNALYLFDASTSQVSRAGLNIGSSSENFDVVRVDFDFSLLSTSASTATYGVLALTSANNTAFGGATERAVSVSVKNNGQLVWSGGSTTLSDPTGAHSLSIVANGSLSDFTYSALDGSGSTTLSSYTFDLYLDDVLLDTDISFTTDAIALGRFGYTTFGGTQGEFLIDNLATYSAIPEPATPALALLGLAFAARKLRRRPS